MMMNARSAALCVRARNAPSLTYLCFPTNLPSPYANGFVVCFSPRRVCVTPPARHAGLLASSSSFASLLCAAACFVAAEAA